MQKGSHRKNFQKHFPKLFQKLSDVLYAVAWTGFQTLLAPRALGVVDDGQIVHKLYRLRGAYTLTLAAGNTACLTYVHNVLTPAIATARDVHLGGNGHASDNVFGTCFDTQTATTTQIGVDVRIAVVALYAKVRACVDATAATHAPCTASLATACKHALVDAVAVALVGVFVLALIAATARNHGYGRFGCAVHLYTQDVGDLHLVFGRCLSTCVEIGSTVNQRFRVTAATGVAACTAVCTGKQLGHFADARILLDGAYTAYKKYAHAQNKCDAHHYADGNSHRRPIDCCK